MVFKGGGIGSRLGCALDLQHPLGPPSFAVFAVPPRIKPPHDFHRAIRRCEITDRTAQQASVILKSGGPQERGSVILNTPDAPEWVAADVCAVLELDPTSRVFRDMDEGEKGLAICQTPGGPQEMLTVTA